MALVWAAIADGCNLAMFGSPQAWFLLQGWWHLGLKLLVFGTGAAALTAANRPGLAWAFGLVYVINKILMVVWRQ